MMLKLILSFKGQSKLVKIPFISYISLFMFAL